MTDCGCWSAAESRTLVLDHIAFLDERAFHCFPPVAVCTLLLLWTTLPDSKHKPQEPPIQAQAKTFDFFRQHIDEAGIHVTDLRPDVLVKFGARADQILEVAAGRASDLIIMGMHCKHGLMVRVSGHLSGSLSYEVMTQAPCAVLAVPADSHKVQSSPSS